MREDADGWWMGCVYWIIEGWKECISWHLYGEPRLLMENVQYALGWAKWKNYS